MELKCIDFPSDRFAAHWEKIPQFDGSVVVRVMHESGAVIAEEQMAADQADKFILGVMNKTKKEA